MVEVPLALATPKTASPYAIGHDRRSIIAFCLPAPPDPKGEPPQKIPLKERRPVSTMAQWQRLPV